MHFAAAEIEKPVGEAQVLGNGVLGKTLKGRGSVGPRTSISVTRTSISPVGHGGIELALFASDDRAVGADDGFLGKASHAVVHFAAGRDNQLCGAVMVGQIDEVNSAVIASVA